MDDFWKNIIRYPRFFISSLAGSVLVIITPFKNLFKVSEFRIILSLSVFFFIFFLYYTIINMTNLGEIN